MYVMKWIDREILEIIDSHGNKYLLGSEFENLKMVRIRHLYVRRC